MIPIIYLPSIIGTIIATVILVILVLHVRKSGMSD